jgi:hypothetical protein
MFLPFSDVIVSKDGDPELREMADRHYSRQSIGHPLFIGPGRKIVLRNPEGTWVFAWRKAELREDGQTGWECTIFRNESDRLSSEIILECEKFVEGRMFTYINARKVRSCNPGYCFKRAGWTFDGKSKSGLVRLAKVPL